MTKEIDSRYDTFNYPSAGTIQIRFAGRLYLVLSAHGSP